MVSGQRESEQPIHRISGDWPAASLLKSSGLEAEREVRKVLLPVKAWLYLSVCLLSAHIVNSIQVMILLEKARDSLACFATRSLIGLASTKTEDIRPRIALEFEIAFLPPLIFEVPKDLR